MRYYRILSIFKDADIKPDDTKLIAISKIESLDLNSSDRQFMLSFIINNWSIEKVFIEAGFNLFDKINPLSENTSDNNQNSLPPIEESVIMEDPCTSPIQKTPSGLGKMKIFKDIAFPTCKGCGGRLFKDFSYCPWCGDEFILPENETTIFFVPLKFSAKSKNQSNKVLVEDPELGVITEAEVKKMAKTIEKHIPKR